MSITRLITSVSCLVLLYGTAKNKIDHPKASLLESIPIVDMYKTVLATHVKNVEAAEDAMDKGNLGDSADPADSHAQSNNGRHHFKHDPTGQTLDMGNGLEPSGENPLNRGPYKK
jgi:hypothetical protein